MAALAPAAYRFGPFVVDRAAYRVLRDGRPLEITPKLLDLLLHFLDTAGSLVTKEALLEALWPDANVTDNALAQAVSELRQALGDEAGDPRFIKTIARRGYRFIAPVDPVAAPLEPPVDETPRVDEHSIAVLDFTNVTGDAESAWLSAGIAETVSGDLRALGRFRVVDRWRVTEAARRTGGALHDVAAALRVRLVVVGSFQRNADRVRITARVVDVLSGEAIADAKVDGRLDDVLDLQDQVAAQFAGELGIVASGGSAPARHRETASLEAYRAVMEGWLRIETLDVRELPRAIADFERAVAIDPRYALGWTGLATAEFASYESTRAENEPTLELLYRAIAHGRQAVQLDASLAEAHGSLALILVSAWDTRRRSARRGGPLSSSPATGVTCSAWATPRGGKNACVPAPPRWRSTRTSHSRTFSPRWSMWRADISSRPRACSGMARPSRIARSVAASAIPRSVSTGCSDSYGSRRGNWTTRLRNSNGSGSSPSRIGCTGGSTRCTPRWGGARLC